MTKNIADNMKLHVWPGNIVIGLLFIIMISQFTDAGIVHRYSFDSDISDSVGNADGLVIDNTGNSEFSQSELTLGNNGSQKSNQNPLTGDFVDLPNGMVSAIGQQVTFEYWVSWGGGDVWQELSYFGINGAGQENASSGTGEYLAVIPKSGAGTFRVTCRNASTGSESYVDRAAPLNANQEYHIAVAWDGQIGIFSVYLDGQLIGSNSTIINLANLDDRNNWLGRSGWNDPLFVGAYNEFRIYNKVLSASEVLSNYNAGPDQLVNFIDPASNPVPANGTENVSQDIILRWDYSSGGIVNHNVYFGSDAVVVGNATIENIGVFRGSLPAVSNFYSVTGLRSNTEYFWRIDEIDENSIVHKGILWQFSTSDRQVYNPQPANSALGVSTLVTLSWDGASGATGHDVYFGTSADGLEKKADNTSKTSYQTGQLNYNTRYYWRIDERFSDGLIAQGIVWSFLTENLPLGMDGDLTGDIKVDLADLKEFVLQWLDEGGCSGYDCADFNKDSSVDMEDFSFLQTNWMTEGNAPIVINEINYNADENTQPYEFIELYNIGLQVIDLSGWYFSDGIEYVFPENTSIKPGEYLVIAEEPNVMLAVFDVVALGPFTGKLANDGEKVTLRDALDEKIDSVEYKDVFPWPVSANGTGASMELIDPYLDNNLAGAWRASSFYASNVNNDQSTIQFVPYGSSSWIYRKGTSEPDTQWNQVNFTPDSQWQSGTAGFGYGDGDDATEIEDMQNNYSSVYLRHDFVINNANLIPDDLVMDVYVDDGCIVYINGTEIGRYYVSDGLKSYNDLAMDHEAELMTVNIDNARDYLVAGNNVVAVHVLNGTLDSSDLSFNLSLQYVEADQTMLIAGPTPGKMNHTRVYNAPPLVRQVEHTPEQPVSNEDIVITAKITDVDGLTSVNLKYQVVLPGEYIPAYLPVSKNDLLVDPWQRKIANPDYFDDANWVTVDMTDDGQNGDQFANDDHYSAVIGGQGNRTLLRYKIVTQDSRGSAITVPYADDASMNFACFVYDGVPDYTATQQSVYPEGPGHTYDAETLTKLPVYSLLTRNEDVRQCHAYDSAEQLPHDDILAHQEARRAYNWEGCFVYDGKVYDHINYRLRGANGRYHLAGKRSMKFKFNRGSYFQARDIDGKKYQEKWKYLQTGKMFGNQLVGNFGLTETLNQIIWNIVGIPTGYTHWFHFRVIDGVQESPTEPDGQYRGDFWGMFLAFENYDVRFLEEHNLVKGNLYKLSDWVFEGERQKRYQAENVVSDCSDYENIRWNLNSTQTELWLKQHVNFDLWYRYHTVSEAIRHYDVFPQPLGRHTMKNMAWYFEPVADNPLGLMWFLPYDSDATWGPTWNEGKDHAKAAIYDGSGKPAMQIEYRNYMREFRDLFWQEEIINPMIDELATRIADFVPADRDRWRNAPAEEGNMDFGSLEDKVADMKTFAWEGGMWPGDIGPYSGSAANLDTLSNAGGDLYSIPYTPTIQSLSPVDFPVNNIFFSCSNFSDPQGAATFAAMKWRIAEVTDMNNLRYEGADKHYYEINPVWEYETDVYTETIRIPASAMKVGASYKVRCKMKDSTGRWSHYSEPIDFIPTEPTPADITTNLRLSELMYNPAEDPAGVRNNNDFEFIEVKNIGTDALDLTNVSFTEGISFSFGGSNITSLAPDGYVLVVKDIAAFTERYGDGLANKIAGQYGGKLSNSGEKITLTDTFNGEILSFQYSDARYWPIVADGPGHSLVPKIHLTANQGTGALDYYDSWRASAYIGGSPGADDPVLQVGLVINELLAHTDYSNPSHPEYDSNDWIELFNASGVEINLSGEYYLSDDLENLKKWALPDGSLASGSFISYEEVNDFHSPIDTGFGLNKAGEQLMLSYLPGNENDRIVDWVSFKGQLNNVSLGRYPDGNSGFFGMIPSRDANNNVPDENLVFSEIMYHPIDTAFEYIEIYNPMSQSQALENADGQYRIDGGVSFVFPANVSIASQSRIIVVDFDPADMTLLNNFMSSYSIGGLAAGVNVFGPYAGSLSNNTDRVSLQQPLAPDSSEIDNSWVIVDEVIYFDQPAWPGDADGTGKSIKRINIQPGSNSSDSANWISIIPSPIF
ncbi:MAG: lamin tail domain-containing protein [Phycisphaerae bacterium]|nr:lamin tail domain-containing protein [Phycisphaerae bacterium]